jgi:hypothetical protein
LRLENLFVLLFVVVAAIAAFWLILVLKPDIVSQPIGACVPQVITVRQEDVSRVQVLSDKVLSLQSQLDSLQLSVLHYRSLYDSCQQNAFSRDLVSYHGSSGSFDLSVIVRDDDGDRLADARVRLENSDSEFDYTDEDGEAFFSGLDEDCYDVTVTKSGYVKESARICLEEDDRMSIVLDKD